jgi:hypothetical protein
MPDGFISAAQARLNFCPELYSEVMVKINQSITDLSRTQRSVDVSCPTKDNTHIRVSEQLKDYGFDVVMSKIDEQTFNMEIRW